MKRITLTLLISIWTVFGYSQASYKTLQGYTVTANQNWTEIPTFVMRNKLKQFQKIVNAKQQIKFDAAFQRVGQEAMTYPYILIRGIPEIASGEENIMELKDVLVKQFNASNLTQLVNGKLDVNAISGNTYYDRQNKLLIACYNVDMSSIGKVTGLCAFYFGTKGTVNINCYERTNKFANRKQEFMNIIYSVTENENTLNSFENTETAEQKSYLNKYFNINISPEAELKLLNKVLASIGAVLVLWLLIFLFRVVPKGFRSFFASDENSNFKWFGLSKLNKGYKRLILIGYPISFFLGGSIGEDVGAISALILYFPIVITTVWIFDGFREK